MKPLAIVAAAALMAFTGCALPKREAPLRVLTRAEIVAYHADRTIYARYSDGGNYIEYHSPDGRVAILERDGRIHRGTWTASDGTICYAYPTLRANASYCFQVLRGDGEAVHANLSGPNRGQAAAVVILTKTGNTSKIELE